MSIEDSQASDGGAMSAIVTSVTHYEKFWQG